MTRRFTFFILMFVSANVAIAQNSPVYKTNEGAIHGYDPVAYLTAGKAVRGSQNFKVDWQGATWYFASAANLETFKKAPERYAPQYGGYCAYGLSRGYKASTDPHAFTVVNGKLYLNYDKNAQAEWLKNYLDRIKKADQTWPLIKDKE